VIFADEPTGNLDSTTGGEILTVLREAVDSYQQTTVMVTHDAGAAAIADRALFLADGLIVRDSPCKDAGDIMAIMADLSVR
jgi:putative ABC transport system ATP-binding protein